MSGYGTVLEIGNRYGRLVLTAHLGNRQYLALCDCGAVKKVRKDWLTRDKGRVVSCGCFRTEARIKHGASAGQLTDEYRIWLGMRDRCRNPRNKKFKAYGGRGINVCARWDDFSLFLSDMGPRPTKEHSVDRVDNDKGYEPGNCKWATRDEQANNTRMNRVLEVNGEVRTLADWARKTGLLHNTIVCRIRRGWPPERAVTEPAKPGKTRSPTRDRWCAAFEKEAT